MDQESFQGTSAADVEYGTSMQKAYNKRAKAGKRMPKLSLAQEAFQGIAQVEVQNEPFTMNFRHMGKFFQAGLINFTCMEVVDSAGNRVRHVCLSRHETPASMTISSSKPNNGSIKLGGLDFFKTNNFADQSSWVMQNGSMPSNLLDVDTVWFALHEQPANTAFLDPQFPQFTVCAPSMSGRLTGRGQKKYSCEPINHYAVYRAEVDRLSRVSSTKYQIAGKLEGNHLDHVFSVREAYDRGFPPELVAHHTNLRYITALANTSKGRRCDKDHNALHMDYMKAEGHNRYNDMIRAYRHPV